MDLKISGRNALVFGASKGLGKAVARELIAEGARVAIVARDPARVAATAAEIGAVGIAGDVSSPGTGVRSTPCSRARRSTSSDVGSRSAGPPDTISVASARP